MPPTPTPISPREKRLAAVSYLPLMGPIVWYFIRHKKGRFVHFHSLQGSIASLYFFAAYGIPVLGTYLALAGITLCCIGFLFAAKGHDFRIPGIATLCDWLV